MSADQLAQHLAAGQALMKARNLPGAIVHLRQALALSPQHAQASATLAACELEQGRVADADATATAALATAAEYAPLHRVKGAIALTRKDMIAAERHLREAVQLGPSDPLSHAVLCQFLTRNARYPEAISAAESALALDHANALVMAIAVDAYVNANRYDEAEKLTRRAYTFAPNHPMVLTVNGFVELRRGRIDSAAEFAHLAASVAVPDRATLSLFVQVQMARSPFLAPLWFAMNAMLQLDVATRAATGVAMIMVTIAVFMLVPAPLHLIVGWPLLTVTTLHILSLRGGDAVVRYMLRRATRTARLKRDF